jgi:hypothetical protein
MKKYNPKTKEQVKKLKDERIIFKTHNGFKYWCTAKNGDTYEVSEEYYNKAKQLC